VCLFNMHFWLVNIYCKGILSLNVIIFMNCAVIIVSMAVLLRDWVIFMTVVIHPWPTVYMYLNTTQHTCNFSYGNHNIRSCLWDCTVSNRIMFFNNTKLSNDFNIFVILHYWVLILISHFVETVHWKKGLFAHPWPTMYMYFYPTQHNSYLLVNGSQLP
jgi:hypothetical protein